MCWVFASELSIFKFVRNFFQILLLCTNFLQTTLFYKVKQCVSSQTNSAWDGLYSLDENNTFINFVRRKLKKKQCKSTSIKKKSILSNFVILCKFYRSFLLVTEHGSFFYHFDYIHVCFKKKNNKNKNLNFTRDRILQLSYS
jgi:hypothetical protein